MAAILVEKLVASEAFRSSERLMKLLQPYYSDLPISQVSRLMDGAIANVQIYSAGDCRTKYLPDFVRCNIEKIPAERIADLQAVFDKDQCFTIKMELPIKASTVPWTRDGSRSG
jgi:hypothetical protein